MMQHSRPPLAEKHCALLLSALLLTACATHPITTGENRHLQATPTRPSDLPKPVDSTVFLPKPQAAKKVDLYSVVVFDVPIREVLFALARDAKLNLDIGNDIDGKVTINAIDQPITRILDRISRQVDIRYSLDNGVLSVVQDEPFFKSYRVDYVNMARTTTSTVSTSTAIAATGGSVSSGGTSASVSNASSTEIKSSSDNQFWKTLEKNLNDVLGISATEGTATPPAQVAAAPEAGVNPAAASAAGDKLATAGATAAPAPSKIGALLSAATANPSPSTAAPAPTLVKAKPKLPRKVIINAESGVVLVKATATEQEKVQEYLGLIGQGSQRQVLIEATIVEVMLSDQYQSGINWAMVKSKTDGSALDNSLNTNVNTIGGNLTNLPFTVLNYAKTGSGLFQGADFSATVKLLEQFGKTKVLSSPKLMAMNNQTAILKVVDEKVYFVIKLTVTPATTVSPLTREVSSEIRTVPIGVLMSVTPQISEDDQVTLNVRPTITRITGYKSDPTLQVIQSSLSNSEAKIESLIPEIQVRELESVLKLSNGQVAVLGGLIQDRVQNERDGVPGLSRLPLGAGDLFSYRNDIAAKTELVIFMRPQIVRDASIEGDLKSFRQYQPDKNFFELREDEISVFKSGLPAR